MESTVQVSRDVLIDRDHNESLRETFQLVTTGDRARLTITRERNAVARLDAWPLAWRVESPEVFVGTVVRSGARTDYDLARGTRRIQLSCSPRTYNVRPATARLLASAGDCRDPRGRWEPATTERVSGTGCAHTEGDPNAPTDASAGVTHSTLRVIAEPGVAALSSGAITHSAPAVDIGLDFET